MSYTRYCYFFTCSDYSILGLMMQLAYIISILISDRLAYILLLMRYGDIMADLTLHEYSDIPEEELKKCLQLEAKKMFHSLSIENNLKDRGEDSPKPMPTLNE